jgi:hypothetical protein
MKLRTRLSTTVWGVLFASLVVFGGSSARSKSSQKARGEVVSGLEMTMQLNQAELAPLKTPKFRVELRNAGDSDLVLNVGVMLANGQKQYPNAVVLTLTDAQGKTRWLTLREPAAVAGRVDPFILPIPAGATFSIPVDLDKYWAAASKDFDYKLKPGSYSLEAQFTGKGVSQQEANLDVKGIALMSYWMGTVTSSRLQFEVPSP